MRVPLLTQKGREDSADGTSEFPSCDERPCPPASGRGSLAFMREPESDSAARAALDRLRRLEARVDALAEAVEVLARGLEGSPMAEPVNPPAREAARRAHELLLLAKPGRRVG
jgi:hypothetical protein